MVDPLRLKNELLWRAFTQYPNFYRGLEIECGMGDRIRVGRKRGHNLFGVNQKDLKSVWVVYGIDPYIRVGDLKKLPYPDESFDFVTCPYPIKVSDSAKALKEIWRVGSRTFYLNLPIGKKKTMNWYIPKITDAGFRIEAIQKSMNGNLIVEAAKG